MGETRFEQMLRPVYEARAAVGWAIAGVWLLGIARVFSAPKLGMSAFVLLGVAITALRLVHASKLRRYYLSLVGKPMAFVSARRL